MMDTMTAEQGRKGMTPERRARGMLIYHWVAVLAAGPVIGLCLRHQYPWAVFFLLVSVVASCMRSLAYGFREGYKEGHRRATKDGDAALDALDESWIALGRPCEISIDPSSALPGEGYVYVIKFSTDVVKVGQTLDLRRRFAEHRRDASAYGVVITNYWVSPAHDNYLDNEIALIGFCDGFGGRAKREYFHDIDFDMVVRFARSMPYYTADPAVTEANR